jgi:hypothetical protein
VKTLFRPHRHAGDIALATQGDFDPKPGTLPSQRFEPARLVDNLLHNDPKSFSTAAGAGADLAALRNGMS